MKYLSLTLPGGKEIEGPLEIERINRSAGPFGSNIIKTAIELLFIFAIILALFFLIWGGIQWMTSRGDKEKLAKAQHTIIYVIVGLVIIFMSFFILQLIAGFFQVPLLGT